MQLTWVSSASDVGHLGARDIRPAPSPARLSSLDTLRGIAIAAVVLAHALGGLGLGYTSVFELLGRAGVTLFFLLSGYLIFRTVQSQSTVAFLSHRFFKLMPSYWLCIALIFLLDATVDVFPDYQWQSYVAGVLAITDVLRIPDVSGVLWTLLIEIKFYVFIAIQYALFGRRYLHLILAALLAFEGAAWFMRGQGSLTLAYFPVFYLGIQLSLAEESGWSRAAVMRLAALTLGLAASLMLFLDQRALGSAASLVICTLLFVMFKHRNWSQSALSFLGLTSYSNYLYHSLVIAGVFALLGPGEGLLSTATIFALGVIAATIVGAFFYRAVEVPMVAFGRRFTAARGAINVR